MARTSRYPQQVRERAVRMVMGHREHYASEWSAIASIAPKVGVHPETPRVWLRRSQVDAGERPGLSTAERAQLGLLRRENAELGRANATLKSAATFCGAELNGRHTK